MSSLANDTGTDRAPEPSHNVVTPGELMTQMRGNSMIGTVGDIITLCLLHVTQRTGQ